MVSWRTHEDVGWDHGCSEGKTCGRGYKVRDVCQGGKKCSSKRKQHQVNWKV